MIGEHGVGWDTGLVETTALHKLQVINYLCYVLYLFISNVSMHGTKLKVMRKAVFTFDRKVRFLTFWVSVNCCYLIDFCKSICRLFGTSLVWIRSWDSGVFWSVIAITATSDNMLSCFDIVWWPMVGLVETGQVGAGWDVHTCVSTIPIRKYTWNCQ